MQLILAENIDGWLFAAAAFFGGIIVSLLALAALIPAIQRNRIATFAMAAPAILFVTIATIFTGYEYLHEGLGHRDYELRDFLVPWFVMAGPPLTMSLLAIGVLWFRSRPRAV